MPQQKSTIFSAAKIANFGVVMADMMGKMGEMEKEIKRLQHHVSQTVTKQGRSHTTMSIDS